MGCFGGIIERLRSRLRKRKSDEEVARKIKEKWCKPKVAINHDQFQTKGGGCGFQVPIGSLAVPSRPPTRTSVIAVKFLLNGNSQEEAEERRAALLKAKLDALQAQNLKREECLNRKKAIENEFRNMAIRTRRIKDARHEGAVSRLAVSRMAMSRAGQVTPTDEEVFDTPPMSAGTTPDLQPDLELEVDPHFNA